MGNERVIFASPSTGRGSVALAAPWLFTGEDQLRVVVANSLAGAVVDIVGRFIDARDPAVAKALRFSIAPTADRMTTSALFALGAGYLLNLSVVVTTGTPRIGQTYAMVQVVRGQGGAVQLLGSLLGGYVTAVQPLSYPGSPIESSIAGGGVDRVISGTAPAPGVELNEAVPAGARWQLLALQVVLGTDATVADRRSILNVQAGGANAIRSPMYGTVPASVNGTLTWATGMPITTTIDFATLLAGLPTDCRMLAGDRITTSTVNFQATDQYLSPNIVVREWLEVNQ